MTRIQGEQIGVHMTTLPELEAILKEESAKRHSLGGYNTDAPTIMILTDSTLLLVGEVIRLRKEVDRLKSKK